MNKCVLCGAEGKTSRRGENKNPICDKCYRKGYKRPEDVCIECKRDRPIHKRNESGDPMCQRCSRRGYKPPKEICIVCGKNKAVQKRDESGNSICRACHVLPEEVCIKCNEFGQVSKRDQQGGPTCRKCYMNDYINGCTNGYMNNYMKTYRRPKGICAECKRNVPIHTRNDDDEPLCNACYSKIRAGVDERFKIRRLLRSRLYSAFKMYSRTGKTKPSDEYGIDYEKIVECLGSRPGDDYEIDHIMPLAAFDFNNPIHIKAAFAPENHQWLPRKDNLSKSDRHDKDEFDVYLSNFLKKNGG